MSRAQQAHFYTNDGKLRVEPEVERQPFQPIDQPETEEQQATCHSPKEWDAALSLVDLCRKACVNDNRTCHHASDDVEVAARQLIQLQREDAELARNLDVEDVGAALALVKASRERAPIGMSTVMLRSTIPSTGIKGWVIGGVRGLCT
jgi:hypothetical protein